MIQRVAITGGIASGKSLFSRFLSDLGAEILDADDVVHQLEGPGGAAVAPLTALFGARVLAADGSIDRSVLGRIVFADRDARVQVNAVLHPMVREVLQQWLATPGDKLKVGVIPLLFEAGWVEDWDVIICLAADEKLQMERLISRRGLTPVEARRRIAAQMPLWEKTTRSHIVIHNTTSVEALEKSAVETYRLLTERDQ